ncbi:MAG: hypothetical protein K5978_07760 [Campylobacter sp.]|nr:hypothetical protein [Campylobacter sp.]
MGKKTLLAVVLLLLLSVGMISVFLYDYADIGLLTTATDSENTDTNATKSTKQENKTWLKSLAKLGKKDYILPVNEIHIEYKRKNTNTGKTAYELRINKNDVYSMFCLTQVLNKSNVDFTIIKDSVKSQIFLNTQDSELLQKIILELRKYNINSSVTEVKI